jgi:hypothetical protein
VLTLCDGQLAVPASNCTLCGYVLEYYSALCVCLSLLLFVLLPFIYCTVTTINAIHTITNDAISLYISCFIHNNPLTRRRCTVYWRIHLNLLEMKNSSMQSTACNLTQNIIQMSIRHTHIYTVTVVTSTIHPSATQKKVHTLLLHKQQYTSFCYTKSSTQFSATQTAVHTLLLHKQQYTPFC